MTAEKKLELIRNEIERCITIFGDCEAKCTTCTNDKGCVTCENGEQWEGKAVDNTKTDDELEESPDTDLFTSNEQKAIELCGKNYKNCNEMLCVGCPRQDFLATLIQMADFKDEQFKEELDHAYHCADHVQYMNGWRDAIEKAEDWLYEHSNEYYITAKAYSDFHEAMREEAQK